MAGGAAPDLAQMQYGAAAPGPSMQFQSLQQYEAAASGPSTQSQSLQQQDDHLYTSYAAKKTKITPGELFLSSLHQFEGSKVSNNDIDKATAGCLT